MKATLPSLAARILLTVCLAAYALLALGSGLDRLSASVRPLERFVPAFLRAEASRSAATLALARGQPSEAAREAAAAVRADPLDRDSAALLGTARLVMQDFEGAEAAYRVAAQFGWRNAATQLYWYDAALQAGEMQLAADRADAILRTRPSFPDQDRLLEPLEIHPGGREALLTALARKPGWFFRYFTSDADVPDKVIARRVTLAEELAAADPKIGCERFSGFVRQLLARGDRAAAERVWNAHCPEAKVRPGLADPDFSLLGAGQRNPFGWIVNRTGDVSVRIEQNDGVGHRLVLENRSPLARLALKQAVTLDPGLYRLRASVSGQQPMKGRIAASLGCNTNPPLPAHGEENMDEGGQVLDVRGCGGQQLGIWIRPGNGPVRLNSVEITKLD